MNRLLSYFGDNVVSKTMDTVGAEVETQFVDSKGVAIKTEVGQKMFRYLADSGWRIEKVQNSLITSLLDKDGNRISYELGRQNIELSTISVAPSRILEVMTRCSKQIQEAGELAGAAPLFAPILSGDEDLLVIPDERDAVWLELDGRSALAPLARTSSVQFTFSVAKEDAVPVLNKLGDNIEMFLADYPQDEIWRRYIVESNAGYREDRYGGPLNFRDLEDYCLALSKQDVVSGVKLLPFTEAKEIDIPLFIRSVWWYFRLKRYGSSLCIEVRPMPRQTDKSFGEQLEKVMKIVEGS